MKQSAGTLLYRRSGETLEVLLVHPAGRYNRNMPWSIPKGVVNPGETLEEAAVRETWEETGVKVVGDLVPLGSMVYRKSRKQVHCFAAPAPEACSPVCQPREVDRAEFLAFDEARRAIHPDQAVFLDRLVEHLKL